MSVTAITEQPAILEQVKTKLISKQLTTSLSLQQVDSIFRQQKRTGRLVIHYRQGGIGAIFFEEVQNL